MNFTKSNKIRWLKLSNDVHSTPQNPLPSLTLFNRWELLSIHRACAPFQLNEALSKPHFVAQVKTHRLSGNLGSKHESNIPPLFKVSVRFIAFVMHFGWSRNPFITDMFTTGSRRPQWKRPLFIQLRMSTAKML